MTHRARSVQIIVRVNEREKALIDAKKELSGIRSLNSYIRKMAIDGYVIRLDMTEVKELISLVRRISNNVNQIAKRANETHHVYAEDVADIRRRQSDIWTKLDALLGIWDKL